MLVALIVKNELVSLLLTGMCMISAAIICIVILLY